ncbi:M16 family metallopeptidase [Cystobacter fuscus]
MSLPPACACSAWACCSSPLPRSPRRPPPRRRLLPAPFTSVEGISEYRLDNGLRVLLFPDPTKSTVTLNITYFVGSRHEGYGETGMAHLLEHLLFKGTPTTPNVPQALTQRGARPNGTTGSTGPTTSRPSPPRTTTCAGRSPSRPTAWSTASSPGRTSTPR